VGRVGLVKACQVACEGVYGRGLVVPDEVLVQRLQGEFARAAALRLRGRLARAVCS